MRIFVTGGTGFIGSHFLNQAARTSHELVALRRQESSTVIPLDREPKWRCGDLAEIRVEDLVGCDALVHFASHGVSPQATDWSTAIHINVEQSSALMEKAMIAGVPHILLCGSCMEYGKSGELYDMIPPDAALRPNGPYAASKAAFSLIAQSMATSSRSEFVLLRPFHVYGEGQHPENLWPSLRRAALAGEDFEMTSGEQVRDFQSVEDTARAFLRTLEMWPGKTGEMYIANLGSGQPITLAEFARSWWQKWAARGELKIGAVPYRKVETMRYVPAL